MAAPGLAIDDDSQCHDDRPAPKRAKLHEPTAPPCPPPLVPKKTNFSLPATPSDEERAAGFIDYLSKEWPRVAAIRMLNVLLEAYDSVPPQYTNKQLAGVARQLVAAQVDSYRRPDTSDPDLAGDSAKLAAKLASSLGMDASIADCWGDKELTDALCHSCSSRRSRSCRLCLATHRRA